MRTLSPGPSHDEAPTSDRQTLQGSTSQTRTLDRDPDALLRGTAVTSIDGAKGVDETDTVTRRARQAWSPDDAGQRGHLRLISPWTPSLRTAPASSTSGSSYPNDGASAQVSG